jgi:DNA-binding CsgD family transcriptional regulator
MISLKIEIHPYHFSKVIDYLSKHPEIKIISKFVMTEREKQVLLLMLQGFKYRDIADRIGVSPRTLETHIDNIYLKTRTRNIGKLMDYAEKNGLLKTLQKSKIILTPLQKKIVNYMKKGFTAEEIAEKLGTTRRSLEYHRSTLYQLSGVSTKSQFIRYAIMHRL